MKSDPVACLNGATGSLSLCFTNCNGTRHHASRRTRAVIGCGGREFYGRFRGFACKRKALVHFTTTKKKKGSGGGVVVVRFQISTNEQDQLQKQQVDERSWHPLGVSHQIGEMVAGKYRIIGVLGQGGVGTTYEAEIIEDGTTVALKALSLCTMKVWKDLELFEREARVLKSLRHPNIPEYIDYFEVDSELDRAFYIAQKVAKGSSLADLVQSGWRFTEQEVVRIAIEILEVWHYHGILRPPVYHRDIKPKNVILDKDLNTIKVVDFGAVQIVASVTLIGSTMIGTYGYMPRGGTRGFH